MQSLTMNNKKYSAEPIYEEFHKDTKLQQKIISNNNFTYKIIIDEINKVLKPNTSILDIGCGAGTIALYLASKGFNILGLDISTKAIAEANKSKGIHHMKNVRFDVMKFPQEFPNEKFDLIICTEVLEHLDDDILTLKTIFRLLNKRGKVIISTPSRNAPMYRMGLAGEFDKRVGHLRRYIIDDLVSKSSHIGFEVISTKKTEGILRNFLFLNPIAGKFIRFIKGPLVPVISSLDNISRHFFGESDLFIVLQKS